MPAKLTALIYVLAACIVILAHDTIPHHHHGFLACPETTHYHEDGSHHDDNADKHGHNDEDNENSFKCLLKQAVILPSGHSKILKCEDFRINLNHDIYLFSDYRLAEVNLLTGLSGYFPDCSLSFTEIVSVTLGLRAPPSL